MHEIRPADPGARRRLLLILAGVAVLGCGLLLGWESVRSNVMAWIMSADGDPARRAIVFLRSVGFVFAALLAAPAAYCFVIAARIEAAGEFPPPGMKLIRETRVVRGDAARGRAWLLRAVAIKLILLAVLCGIIVWAMAGTLVD